MAKADPDKLAMLREMARNKALARLAKLKGFGSKLWAPNDGRQTDAYWCEADELFYGGGAGGGKALALDTLLPTPSGFTTMRDVQPGDMLLDEECQPVEVIATSPVQIHRDCYQVRFNDGTVIVADAEHRWLTRRTPSREENRPEKHGKGPPTPKVHIKGRGSLHPNPTTRALSATSVDLPSV
ncbi:MAG: hypothetical protein ACR2RE_21285 [Geminicoccaceae bacterium]